jgi:hypothetical protein
MQKTTCLIVGLFSLTAFQSAFAQGSLTPPGSPAPTMRSLDQIFSRTDSRVPITNGGFNISQPGSYYLATNINVTTGNAISINTSGVTLDLNGFTISSTASPNSGFGVLISSGLSDITIRNGHIRGGVTNNGSNVYSGPGFQAGVLAVGSAPLNVRISDLTVSGCSLYAISLPLDSSSSVEHCSVTSCGGFGIFADMISHCIVMDVGSTAISGTIVSDCRGETTTGTVGINGTTVQNSRGVAISGAGVQGTILLNCYGRSTSGFGINALDNASCCYGRTTSGSFALSAANANLCTGYKSGGTAVQAYIANGCYAEAGTNNVTFKYNMP